MVRNGLLLRSLSRTKVLLKASSPLLLHLHFPLEICCNAYVISSVKDQQKKGLDFWGQNYKLVFVLETRKLFWFGSTLFSTWTSVHPGKGKCKKQRQKKAKFFIIETGKLLFLTGYSTCQKMLTLWGQTIFFPRLYFSTLEKCRQFSREKEKRKVSLSWSQVCS